MVEENGRGSAKIKVYTYTQTWDERRTAGD